MGKYRSVVGLVVIAFAIRFGAARHAAYPIGPQEFSPSSNPVAASVADDASNAGFDSPNLIEVSTTDDLAAAAALTRLIRPSVKDIGEPAQNFSLPDSAGKLVDLSRYRGKTVFLNFWATWCPTCRGEMASMESMYREYGGRHDIAFLAVSVDEEGWSKILPYVKEISFDLPVLADTQSQVSAAYGVTAIPTTFIIGRSGRIVWNCAGGIDWTDANVKAAIAKLFRSS